MKEDEEKTSNILKKIAKDAKEISKLLGEKKSPLEKAG